VILLDQAKKMLWRDERSRLVLAQWRSSDCGERSIIALLGGAAAEVTVFGDHHMAIRTTGGV
jgi:hypothetical protein